MPAYKLVNKRRFPVPRVIIVRGAPGVGKTEIARKTASLLKARKKARIPIDFLQDFDMRGPSKDKMKLGVYHAAVITRSYVREGFDVVIDYVFDVPEDLEFFVDKVFRSNTGPTAPCVIQIFYLTAPLEIVSKRNQSRDLVMNKSLLAKLYKACEKSKGATCGEIVIDTARRSIKQVAKMILQERTALRALGKVCQIELSA
jgi:predicted kinase